MLKTQEEIKAWLDKYKVENYTINDDLSVDVNGSVDLSDVGLKRIFVQFGIVHGNFYCGNNKLISMEGFPYEVRGSLLCQNNQLTDFAYCPKVVFENFNCTFNPILSIKKLTPRIGGNFSHYTTVSQPNKIMEIESHYLRDKKSNTERYFVSLSSTEIKSILATIELQEELSHNNIKTKKLKI